MAARERWSSSKAPDSEKTEPKEEDSKDSYPYTNSPKRIRTRTAIPHSSREWENNTEALPGGRDQLLLPKEPQSIR